MEIIKKLYEIQQALEAPKGQYNSFGKYKFRSNEDILTALKPHLKKQNCIVKQSDKIVLIGNRYYVEAMSSLLCTENEERIDNVSYARESENKKGMDDSQITGSASSYARKYSLSGLFAIDDEKDADTKDNTEHTHEVAPKQPPKYDKPSTRREPGPAMSEQTGTGFITEVSVKSGQKKNGQPYNRYGVTINDVTYGTFSDTLGKQCQEFKGKTEVDFVFTYDGKYYNLVAVEPIIRVNQDDDSGLPS